MKASELVGKKAVRTSPVVYSNGSIDIFMDSWSACINFGRQNVKVVVVE